MKIVVFKGGLGNQLFQYAFYKYLSRKDETFYFYNDAWYNVRDVKDAMYYCLQSRAGFAAPQ